MATVESKSSKTHERPTTLLELRTSGWHPKGVKREMYDNFMRMLAAGEELFPGIIGYDDTVVPEINLGLIAQHDMLFLGEKGQGKSRLMRLLSRFLDEAIPYLDIPGCPVHEDPCHPITSAGKRLLAEIPDIEVPIAWWPREHRYAERLAPGTKFADIIGEIDPSKLASGTSMSAEESLHFGLIPRMHRGIFAVNELPELDELVQVGLFNILEERDVQIRGYPIRFDIDVMILFSANPATFNRSGKVIPQLKDRIGSAIHTHYPLERQLGIEIMEQESRVDLGGTFPVVVPFFMREIIEEMSTAARKSKYIDQQSGVSARFSIANYRTMVASAAARGGPRRAAGRAADQRPGPPVFVVAGQAGIGHDEQPPDVGAAGAGRHHGRGHPQRLRGVRRSPRVDRGGRDLLPRREDRGRRPAAFRQLRRPPEARAARLGQGLRSECLERCRRAGVVRRVRAGGAVRHRSHFPFAAARADRV